MKRLLFAMLLPALAACSTYPTQSDADRLAMYSAHAGEPVPSFSFSASLNGWTALGEEAVVLWTRPNQAYLVRFTGPCPHLDAAPGISVSSQFNTVYSNFDRVTVLGRGMSIPCRIREIRPLDVKAIRQAERDMRATAQVSERP